MLVLISETVPYVSLDLFYMKVKSNIIDSLGNSSLYKENTHNIKYKTYEVPRLFETFFDLVNI
jgi:hypothetical protein